MLMHVRRLGLLLLLALPTSLMAQAYATRSDPEFWHRGQLVTDKGSFLKFEGLKPKDIREVKKNTYFDKAIDEFEDQFWTVKKAGSTAEDARLELYASPDAIHWNLEGYVKNQGSARPLGIWPVQGDRFLAVFDRHVEMGEGSDKEASPFVLLRRGKTNAFDLAKLLPCGFVGRLRWKDKDGMYYFAPENALLSLIWGKEFVRTPSALVLFNTSTGYFWSVDTGKESLELRFGALYPEIQGPKLGVDASDSMQIPILAVHPRPNGHVLIASRSEDAMFKSREAEAKLLSARPLVRGVKSDTKDEISREEAMQMGVKAYPDLLWWDLDPATMQFKREDPPVGAPGKLRDLAFLRKFTFQQKADGSVVTKP